VVGDVGVVGVVGVVGAVGVVGVVGVVAGPQAAITRDSAIKLLISNQRILLFILSSSVYSFTIRFYIMRTLFSNWCVKGSGVPAARVMKGMVSLMI
jgi:hypothetical protein